MNSITVIYGKSVQHVSVSFLALTMWCQLSAFILAADLNSSDPAQRRNAIIEVARKKSADSVRDLTATLNDSNAVVRHTAARELREMGMPAIESLTKALHNSDPEIRMTAFLALNDLEALKIENIAAAIKDNDSVAMRMSAVEILARMPQSKVTREMLEMATKDESKTVKEIASKALNSFPFFRQTESIRDHADQIVNVIQTISLPEDGWKLKFDSQRNGHTQKWFAPKLSEADWTTVGMGKFWDEFGFKNKIGIGWYRGRFILPEKPKMNAVELSFGAVDESAWIWINGEYAGQHDIGPKGQDVPFRIDITPFLKWNAENQITVRVLNTAMAGGIWKPVKLEVIRLGN